MHSRQAIVWFRSDLRLADNPALHHACSQGYSILPIFIFSPEEEMQWSIGGASRWWLHHSLHSLDESLRSKGSKLLIFKGRSLTTLLSLIEKTGATALFWNRRYEPEIIVRDKNIKEVMRIQGLEVETFNGSLLHEPWTIQNKSQLPFQVFTPFWKNALSVTHPSAPLPPPDRIPLPSNLPESSSLDSLQLLPSLPWDQGFYTAWKPGESGARKNITDFIRTSFASYTEGRNLPAEKGTSRLSPHLHFGEISPRQIWHAFSSHFPKTDAWQSTQYLSEIGWREFSYHLLYHFPQTPLKPLRPAFEDFAWNKVKPSHLRAWKKGITGIPIVDAGMRELWATGWMHNRVRMITASFLVKNLRYPWIEGARWFWETLVDADLASNTLGWQWSAGCGADAAPYFRIFNPVSQGEKFDPEGTYVRRWIPELSQMPADWIHHPWESPTEILRKANVTLGLHYPHPILSLAETRNAALEAFKNLKK
jgi:deoxyribodipyrimidine photo-lyase